MGLTYQLVQPNDLNMLKNLQDVVPKIVKVITSQLMNEIENIKAELYELKLEHGKLKAIATEQHRFLSALKTKLKDVGLMLQLLEYKKVTSGQMMKLSGGCLKK